MEGVDMEGMEGVEMEGVVGTDGAEMEMGGMEMQGVEIRVP
jgi:hypothetical protein